MYVFSFFPYRVLILSHYESRRSRTSWTRRRADVKYKKSEVFVDVVESFNLSTSAKDNVFHRSLALSSFSPPRYPDTILRADADDHIQMQAFQGLILKFCPYISLLK